MLQFGSENPNPEKDDRAIQYTRSGQNLVPDPSPCNLTSYLSEIIFNVIQRRAKGEHVCDEEIITAHPELMPELGEELLGLKDIRRAVVMGKYVNEPNDLAAVPKTELKNESAPSVMGDISDTPRNLRIQGYLISGEISSGGQATVFKAIQERTGRAIAIKVFHGGPFVGSRGRIRFDRESEVMARLTHPNIVGILDRGRTDDGSFFLVMDFIDGVNLDIHLQHLGKDAIAILQVFIKIARAVDDAHRQGVVHRDLKPMNILVGRRGEPHILDFGMARLLEDFDSASDQARPASLTRTGQILGSLPWSSPEQSMGQHDAVDARSDVYALGVMLYCALAGDFPYKVFCNPKTVAFEITNTRPTPIVPLAVHNGITLPKGIDRVVGKALSKVPSDRYQSAEALANDLEACLAGKPPSVAAAQSPQRWVIPIFAVIVLSTVGVWMLWPNRVPLQFLVNGVNMRFVRIPAGSVRLPSLSDSSRTASVPDTLSVDHDFYLSSTPVTQEQYVLVVGHNPRQRFYNYGAPVQNITKEQAIEFCKELSVRDQRPYRLPTVNEWKYAYYSGQVNPLTKEELDRIAWYAGNSSSQPHSVCQRAPDRWGLYDMIGNVRQWCLDSENNASRATTEGVDYSTTESSCLQQKFDSQVPANTEDNTIGFRVVCESLEQK